MGMAVVPTEQDGLCPECHQRLRCEDPGPHGRTCQRPAGHPMPHLAAMEGNKALRWGVVEVGCYDPDCKKGPDHEGSHNDGRGMTWVRC